MDNSYQFNTILVTGFPDAADVFILKELCDTKKILQWNVFKNPNRIIITFNDNRYARDALKYNNRSLNFKSNGVCKEYIIKVQLFKNKRENIIRNNINNDVNNEDTELQKAIKMSIKSYKQEQQTMEDMKLAKKLQREFELKDNELKKDMDIAKTFQSLLNMGIKSDEIEFNLNSDNNCNNNNINNNTNNNNISNNIIKPETIINIESKDDDIKEDISTKTKSNTELDTNKECTICSDDINNGETIEALECMHVFHEDCIQEWLQEQPICPICRHPHK